jgi:hypothetical protein
MIILDVTEQKAELITLDVQMKKLASLVDVKIIVNN